jgi:MFS family permease
VVFAALVLQGLTGGVLGPAIAAISLGLVGHPGLAERLGRNQRFASAGALTVTGVMGAIGYFLSYRAIFFISAALVLPLIVAVARVRCPAQLETMFDWERRANSVCSVLNSAP